MRGGEGYLVEVGAGEVVREGGTARRRDRKRVPASAFLAEGLSTLREQLSRCLKRAKARCCLLLGWLKLRAPVSSQTAAGLFTATAARSPALAIPALTQTTLTASGPSLLLREDLSPSASTLSALTTPENASRTTSCSTMARMLTPPRLDRIAAQWVKQTSKNSQLLFLNNERSLKRHL